MRAALACAIAFATFMDAQETRPVIQNTGKPIKLDFQCSPEDIHSAGLGCTEEEPCAVYLDLTTFEPAGNSLYLLGNIHSQASTLYALALASNDGGKTWREPLERLRGASLDHLRFVDFEYGWIGGQLIQPLPHDPFVMITTDGGKTWRKRPLFDEPRHATILQLWFDSRTTGSVVLDRGQSTEGMRYELHESPTGGESWMVREAADKPLKIRRAALAPVNSDWRIRADAHSKSFRVERRESGKWNVVISFLFQLDSCKPPAPKELEPPPEQPPLTDAVETLQLPVRRQAPSLKK